MIANPHMFWEEEKEEEEEEEDDEKKRHMCTRAFFFKPRSNLITSKRLRMAEWGEWQNGENGENGRGGLQEEPVNSWKRDPPYRYSHFGVRRSLLAKYLNLSFSSHFKFPLYYYHFFGSPQRTVRNAISIALFMIFNSVFDFYFSFSFLSPFFLLFSFSILVLNIGYFLSLKRANQNHPGKRAMFLLQCNLQRTRFLLSRNKYFNINYTPVELSTFNNCLHLWIVYFKWRFISEVKQWQHQNQTNKIQTHCNGSHPATGI